MRVGQHYGPLQTGLAVMAAALALLGSLGAWSGWTPAALIALCAACLAALLFVGRAAAGYNSLAAIFVGFFALYGVSAPVSEVLGLGRLAPTITVPYETERFLAQLGLALAGLIGGLVLIHRLLGRWHPAASLRSSARWQAAPLLYTALALAAVASGFEIVNFVRAGGVGAVAAGKAVYQSNVADLVLTLPSQIVSYFAVAAFALFVAAEARSEGWRLRRSAWMALASFLVLLGPLLVTTLVLTRRTEIIAWILIAFVGTTWFSHVRRITATMIAIVLGAYMASAVMVAARGEIKSLRFDFLADRAWWSYFGRFLNPGVGEFGAPFGVASEYLKKEPVHRNRWGSTYLEGVASAVPGFLWPGAKPRPVDMEVRDRLFPSYRHGAALESPGFSPILEAYMNFGTLGIFIVFLLVGVAVGGCEALRAGPVPLAMLYLALLPVGQTFHRSAFGPAVISVGAMTLAVLALSCAIYLAVARCCRPVALEPR